MQKDRKTVKRLLHAAKHGTAAKTVQPSDRDILLMVVSAASVTEGALHGKSPKNRRERRMLTFTVGRRK